MHQTITITLNLESLAYVAGAAALLLALPGIASAYWRGRVASKLDHVECRIVEVIDELGGVRESIGEIRGLLGRVPAGDDEE